ncbi:MAG TPA: hypothetical protein VD965_05600 [Burkholderiales bacterium]|nr:hypothetical protein [Burkholderiales bacterium]
MNRITYEAVMSNPELLEAIHRQARRERAAAFDHYVFAPLKSFFRAGRLSPAPRGLKYHRA